MEIEKINLEFEVHNGKYILVSEDDTINGIEITSDELTDVDNAEDLQRKIEYMLYRNRYNLNNDRIEKG